MLEVSYLKKLSLEDLEQQRKNTLYYLDLEQRRLSALRRTQKRNPSWSFYNETIGEDESIDTLIEIWEAVVEELETDLKMVNDEQVRRKSAAINQQSFERRAYAGAGVQTPGGIEAPPGSASPKPQQARMF